MWNRILFPTDHSKLSGNAWQHALYWAAFFGAELHRLHVDLMFEEESSEDHPSELEAEKALGAWMDREKALALNKKLMALDKIQVKNISKRGLSAVAEICDYATSNKMDLIIMPTHGRKILEHFLLGSIAEEVLQKVDIPILSVRNPESELNVRFPYKRVLFPVDFNPCSERACDLVRYVTSSFGADLTLYSVLDYRLIPSHLVDESKKPNVMTETLDRLGAWSSKNELRGDVACGYGVPSTEISHFAAQSDMDLMVIGTHGRKGFSRFLLGSVAEQVLRKSFCPVLVAK